MCSSCAQAILVVPSLPRPLLIIVHRKVGVPSVPAASQPAGYVHPRSLALLAAEGIPTEGYHSKPWDALPITPDIVITVCGSAAGETCPAYLGAAVRTHWGVEDPALATGTDTEINAVFRQAYTILRHRIEAFFALPLSQLQSEPDQLKQAMDTIASIQ